jgi:hypothetical protein
MKCSWKDRRERSADAAPGEDVDMNRSKYERPMQDTSLSMEHASTMP